MRSFVLVAALAGSAGAEPMTVTGDVMDARSRWVSDGTRIVTEATVHTDAGDVVVSQLGGTVDGLTMRTFPGPDVLQPGMRAAIAAHKGLDPAQQVHTVVH